MQRLSRLFSLSVLSIALLGMTLSLSACNDFKNQLTYDRSADLTADDYRRELSERELPDVAFDDANIPKAQPYVSTPESLKERMPLVSLSVSKTVPLRDLLFELANQADFDLEMDPQIQGSIIFKARNRPFDEVIERISDMAGLRYSIEDGLLRVQLDRPYHKNYKIDYLNVVRTLNSNITLNVSVVSGDEADVGSGSSINTTADTDFWAELDANIEQILTSSDNFISLATLSDPVYNTTVPVPPLQYDAQGNPLPQGAVGLDGSVAPVLNVQFPAASEDPPIPNSPAAFSVNKQSGLISIYGTRRQQNEMEEYLGRLRDSILAQVLIEAKILSVSLTDEYAAGINWDSVSDAINVTGLARIDADFARPALSPATAVGNGFTASLTPGSDLSTMVDAISRFGTVRALSSPRITALNHQPAVLNVVENRVFFEFDVNIENGDAAAGEEDTIEIDTEIRSVPEGVLLTVMPSIDVDTGQISLVLRPTVSTVVDTVQDPTPRIAAIVGGVALADASLLDDIVNEVPELSVQEIDSIVKLQSGQVLVMGGLMRDTNTIEEERVPVLGDIPMVGNLFKNHVDRVVKTELVIFLKATLIPGSNVENVDKELYKKFGQDRRPFRM